MPDKIVFSATIAKVQTLVDNGIRVTLDLDENSVMVMAQLVECKRAGAVLKISAMPVIAEVSNGL
jgi:hypothetical protein